MKKCIENYIGWLTEKTECEKFENELEISLPFLDRHNDYLEFKLIKESDKLVLTDDGYYISDLFMSGLEFDTERKLNILYKTVQRFGAEKIGSEIRIETDKENLGESIHEMIQTLLQIDSLYLINQPKENHMFVNDVLAYFDEKEIPYILPKNHDLKAILSKKIDFILPKYNKKETFVKTVGTPNHSQISTAIFNFEDIKKTGDLTKDYGNLLILKDVDEEIKQNTLDLAYRWNKDVEKWSDIISGNSRLLVA
ncbi:DUF1828 domain-containing protein [Methanococcus maripaludis]|uniref:DUF1828 domain-containing protein n=1 Tax=Methanococcus maripaludis TaxID=39152 RepID=A0A7J9SCM2_METMI|nr:DUF1828 domain-containing protein [Methanococcus maripaludis]MBB6497316.1 hypothetical protein [Methanococcus maripaludis]